MKRATQKAFSALTPRAARLYALLTDNTGMNQQVAACAEDILAHINGLRLLEVGFGPGRLLAELHRLGPSLELHGIDISPAMVNLAREQLSGLPVNLTCASIDNTSYPDDFFDMVTCSGSFYLWENPVAALDEIYRILKSGGAAVFFETHREAAKYSIRAQLKRNLQGAPLWVRWLAPFFLKRQLQMTYSWAEIEDIIMQSPFRDHHSLEKMFLGNLPIFVRISLHKH